MAFGIIGILVTIGVIVWIMSAVWLPSAQNAANVKKKVEPQVQQISGHDASTGEDARQTIKLDAESKNGKMTGVLVTAITPGGAMEKYFGLKRGDIIVEISPQGGVMMPVNDMSNPSEAKDSLLAAFQNMQQIVVIRDEKKLTLPAAPVGGKPSAPASPADAVQKQLDQIKIQTH